MLANGLHPHQASEVRGYADERLKLPDRPEDPSNRRISLLVQYLEKPEAPPKPDPRSSGGAPPAQTAGQAAPSAAKH
jgi:chemotaxis protein MotB